MQEICELSITAHPIWQLLAPSADSIKGQNELHEHGHAHLDHLDSFGKVSQHVLC